MLTLSSPEAGFNLSLVFMAVLSNESVPEHPCCYGMLWGIGW